MPLESEGCFSISSPCSVHLPHLQDEMLEVGLANVSSKKSINRVNGLGGQGSPHVCFRHSELNRCSRKSGFKAKQGPGHSSILQRKKPSSEVGTADLVDRDELKTNSSEVSDQSWIPQAERARRLTHVAPIPRGAGHLPIPLSRLGLNQLDESCPPPCHLF